jgi:hypothetical protein
VPATRDQADAYRFGLRRLEAALVHGDPIPDHERVRAQRRATVIGLVLGLLALGGVVGYPAVVSAGARFAGSTSSPTTAPPTSAPPAG